MSPIVVGLLVRALVLLTLAWVAVTLLRRQSASLRALVWTAALTGVLLLPALTAVTPTLAVPVFTAAENAGSKDPASEGNASDSGIAGSEDPASVLAGGRTFRSAEVAGSEDPASENIAPASENSGARTLAFGEIAFIVWALVALGLVTRIAKSHFSLSRLARASAAASANRHSSSSGWAALVDETRLTLGIRRSVHVRTTDAIGVPAVAGLFKPVLLLPAEADDWTEETKRAVVMHELAHVARWDAVGQLLSQVACAVYWCVPLAWHGARRAAILREQASDDVVLMSGIRASAYAANLLNVAELTGNCALEPATLAMAHPRRIRERIVAILDPASVRTGLRGPSVTAVTLTAATVAIMVAAVQPTAHASPVSEPSAVAVTDVSVSTGTEVPLKPRPEPPPQTASSRPCDREMDRSSSSINDDGREKRWRVTMSSPTCKVDMRVDGAIEFNDTFTDVKSLARGGTFRLDVTEGGVRRELEMQERNGSLDRIYRIDGRERPFDSEGQRWFAEFLVTLDRRTAVGVDVRLPALMRQGGVNAVLKETALMYSDYPRSRYYQKLMATRQLNDSERAMVLRQVASMTRSDHYASEVLKEVGRGGFEDTEVRTAALAIIDRMESDHYRSESVGNVVGGGRPTAGDMDVLVRTVERIKSDHYKLEVLRRLVNGPLQPQHRQALSRAARTVDSDHYAAEFLKALLRNGAATTDRGVFFDVIETIQSDHYVLEVLKALVTDQAPSRTEFQQGVKVLARIESEHYASEAVSTLLTSREVTEADLLTLVSAIAPMKSDHYKSESLQDIARHRAAGDRVRTAVIEAADRMSSHYREQVRRAAGR